MATRFAGKVVLVTGAASGIGQAAAAAFAREGGMVACCDVDRDGGESVVRELSGRGLQAIFVPVDVRDADSVAACVDHVVTAYGRLDIALNNAGVNKFCTLHEMTVEDWDELFLVNTRGVFLAMKFQIPAMLAAGGGCVIITGSAIQKAARPGSGAYAASKRALVGIAQAAALDYGTKGIRVNVLAPGTTDTPMVHRMSGVETGSDRWPEIRAAWASSAMPGLRRMASPDEIASAALALASDDCAFVTGTTLFVDGGMTAAL